MHSHTHQLLTLSLSHTPRGSNSYGELGYGDTLQRGSQPFDMGDNLTYVDLGPGRTALSISTSVKGHTCAILDDLSLKCW
jgi:hypothetical protein